MPSLYMICPNCREEMEVLMDYEGADPGVGINGAWIVDGFVHDCPTDLTAEQEQVLTVLAEEKANGDPEFGVTHHEY